MTDSDTNLEAYTSIISLVDGIELKGKTMPYTSINGHMFSHLSKEGTLGLRLSKTDRDAFIKKYNSKLFIQHERIMKEFVEVPSKLLHDELQMSNWFKKSFEYTKSLKPKKK